MRDKPLVFEIAICQTKLTLRCSDEAFLRVFCGGRRLDPLLALILILIAGILHLGPIAIVHLQTHQRRYRGRQRRQPVAASHRRGEF